jgi:hypothetical protein
MSFLEELAKKGIINTSQIGEIKNLAQTEHNGDIDEALKDKGVTEDKILEAKGEYLGIPTKRVDTQGMSFDVLKYISED